MGNSAKLNWPRKEVVELRDVEKGNVEIVENILLSYFHPNINFLKFFTLLFKYSFS